MRIPKELFLLHMTLSTTGEATPPLRSQLYPHQPHAGIVLQQQLVSQASCHAYRFVTGGFDGKVKVCC